jgi:hypothetical protein
MRSLGYDNITLLIRLTPLQWSVLQAKCHYKDTQGYLALLLDKIFVKRYIGFTIADSSEKKLQSLTNSESVITVLCNLNIPKLVNDNNVLLASPAEVLKAFEIAEQFLPVKLSEAHVQSVHFTYTHDTQYSYSNWGGHFCIPKQGNWTEKKFPNGFYYNLDRSLTLAVYEKKEQLSNKWEVLPQYLKDQILHEHLLRIELRMNTKVRDKLSKQGLWVLSTLKGSDLCSPEGFMAFVRYFEYRVPKFIKPPQNTIPLTSWGKVLLSCPKQSMKYLKKQNKEGRVGEQLNNDALLELLCIQAQERPKELLSGIKDECKAMYEYYKGPNAVLETMKGRKL